ncbi:hypothetical protein TNCV_1856851 [Trichonephila clavipes]|nr:hypothetical protein TNCV_1856851 [Trichonephila clavipes]
MSDEFFPKTSHKLVREMSDEDIPETNYELVREILACIGLDLNSEIVNYLVTFNAEEVKKVVAELEQAGAIPIFPSKNPGVRIPYTVRTSPISSEDEETEENQVMETEEKEPEASTSQTETEEKEPEASTSQTQSTG